MADLTIDISISVKQTVDQIEAGLLRELVKVINKRFRPLKKLIQADLAIEVPKLLKQRDVTGIYDKLVNGPLNLEFGFIAGEEESRIDEILTQIGKSVRVDYKDVRVFKGGFTLGSGFTTKILRTDFIDILKLPAATVINISKNPKASRELHWLNWLLLKGDAIIIADHDIKFVEGKGRSGGAVMVSNRSGSWSVPAGSSGTRNSNWLTKEIEDSKDFLRGLSLGIVEKHIQSVL